METKGNYLVLRRLAKQRQKKILSVLIAIAVIVAIVVFWWLKLTGITMTGEALCDYTEHTHSDTCYQYTLICTDESEEHIHTADCTEKVLACTAEEHIHTAECYTPILDEEETSENEEYDAPPLMAVGNDGASSHEFDDDIYEGNIRYTSHLEDEVVGYTITDQSGNIIGNGGIVYLGEQYNISISFTEINNQDPWIQFRHNESGYITYHIPSNLKVDPFDDWHPITAELDDGTIERVGWYFVDETGLLKVHFDDIDHDGNPFFDRYSNTEFGVEFGATVAGTASGTETEIDFSENISVTVTVDGGAEMISEKIFNGYDPHDNTLNYSIFVKATKGVVLNPEIEDIVWDKHTIIRDSIVVTDLEGNVLDPQPTITSSSQSAAKGSFIISDLPDIAAGEGYYVTYKTKIDDDVIANYEKGKEWFWNEAHARGEDSKGGDHHIKTTVDGSADLSRIDKSGSQEVIKDANGNDVSVIKWDVEIKNSTSDMVGTVVIDTLGEGLQYYEGRPILVKRYDENHDEIKPDVEIPWQNVTVNGNQMSFTLPEGHKFDISYYTTFIQPENGVIKYTNSVKATVNGKEEQSQGSANVVGFTPKVSKKAWGNDGKFVNFNIDVEVPATIQNMGYFYLTDLSAFWNYPTDGQTLFVDNKPLDMVITATLTDGRVINFTPYVEGGPVENTYILVTPSLENGHHSFNVLFNTSDKSLADSKWIYDVGGTLSISYKLPFDAKTGTEWTGALTGDKVLSDILYENRTLYNEAYFNYTNAIEGKTGTSYEYKPKIIKEAVMHENGVIDYKVVFHNSIPGYYGKEGYLNGDVNTAYFTDTFSEELEYVEGSLKVTCYDPWRDWLWLNKYEYNGKINGNSIDLNFNQFTFEDFNEASIAEGWSEGWFMGMKTLESYYKELGAGGDYVFTYQLKLKDDYLWTTDYSHYVLDNTAEITWDDTGSSGTASETVYFDTGLLDKAVEQDGDELKFEVVVNRNGLDLLEGKETLTVTDDMSPNLSVYWESIKLRYKDENGALIDFSSPDSEYTYDVVYDAEENILSFIIPDSLPIIIDYTTLVTESGTVSIVNSVKVDGKANVSDIIDAEFEVTSHSGSASGSRHNFTLIKQDGITNERLPNAKFALYAPVNPNIKPPTGTASSIEASDGSTLFYIDTYTTGEDGTQKIDNQYLTDNRRYALVELEAPEGYQLLKHPVEFYFYAANPDAVTQNVTTLLAIQNFNVGGEILPETGSVGTLPFTICGVSLMALPLLYCIRTRRKERRRKAATL